MNSSLSDQSALHARIVETLKSTPELWGDIAGSPVQIIETHGATVLLGTEYAVKIKKPVLFDHMDYSTPARRKNFCDIELERNKRTAKDLYLGVFPIFLGANGDISLQGTAEPVEYFLKMRRFKAGDRLDEIAAAGPLNRDLCLALAEDIADLHLHADIITDKTRIPDYEEIIHKNFQQFYDFCPDILLADQVDEFFERIIATKKRLEPLIDKQTADGQVRIGHGDLHLQNICLFGGAPRIFDAIEYQDDFTISDILYDLVFLTMDLIDKDQHNAASIILNEYVADMGWLTAPARFEALELLPFYHALRSGIRCHVAANRARQCETLDEQAQFAEKAKELFQIMMDYLSPAPPKLYAIGGFSGSGKSTLARELAAEILPKPGAIILRTDVIRRHLIGADKYSPMPQSAYTPDMSDQVYSRMRELAGIITKAGSSVILDAVFDRAVDRDRIDALANDLGVPFQGIWMDVSKEIMFERINARTHDASDATAEILEAQLARSTGIDTSWLRLSADGTPAENYENLRQSLKKLP